MSDFGPLFSQSVSINLTNGDRVFKPTVKTNSEPISDFGLHIGGARKELRIVRSNGDSVEGKDKRKSLPFWLPKKYVLTNQDDVRTYKNGFDPEKQVGVGNICIIHRKARYYDRVIRWGYENHEEALKALSDLFVGEIVFIGEDKEENEFYLYKRMANADAGILRVKTGFKNAEEANKYRSEHALSLLEFKFKAPELPHLDKIVRKGVDYRSGRDITAQELCETFGFPGVEFGNWLTQKERQAVLNHSFDAFMDLCEITGLPHHAMSLNGLLAAAFGSRGIANALAHFEPDRFVFNLSRLKGAGSLAHEWFHALDNYIGASATGIRLERDSHGFISSNQYNYATIAQEAKCSKWQDVVCEFKNLADTMRSRLAEVDFVKSGELVQYQKMLEKYYTILSKHEARIMNELKTDRSYRSRFGKPATAEQLAQVEKLLDKIRNGGQGAECVHPNRSSFHKAWYYRSYEKVEELAKIIKAVRNREFFGENAMMSEYCNTIYWILSCQNTINEKMKQGKCVRTVNTDYFKESKHIDSFRSKPYWSTTIEMVARAFGAFVQDSIEEKGGYSPYLVHSHTNEADSNCKPYPEGEERKTINDRFNVLFEIVRTIL